MMRERNRTRTYGRNSELATLIMRLAAFVATIIPLVALAAPWVRVDGSQEAVSGVGSIALLVSPMSEYLFTVSPLHAAILTVGPILIGLLATITSYNYWRRRSIIWGPPAILGVALVIAYGATDLVNGYEFGLATVIVASALLTLHQITIRVQVLLRRKAKMPQLYRRLAVITGMGHYRWSEQ
ncbi:MAG: hypothetical protein F4X64_05045 [Chloroflexi bacterium]|nr:hypothetical protein [Chloroflexota bacterium]